ncbi:MAG: putative beta-lysine N-acetyltransferase [Cytophagales bacterium]|nr:putative beta-lysine N-acetyltransferase [Cytophagales bacterium]
MTSKKDSSQLTLYPDPYSRRLRVDDYEGPVNEVVKAIDTARQPWAEKVIIKSRPGDVAAFRECGYEQEAIVSKYFAGTDMHFLARYFAEARRVNEKAKQEDDIIRKLLASTPAGEKSDTSRVLFGGPDDADELAGLYKRVFPVYPTPVGDPHHIRKTMAAGTLYALIRDGHGLMSAASAEVNRKYLNAELTDCASAEEVQGKGYMRMLLTALESTLKSQGIGCFYTIARSESYGMNKVFHQLGYSFGGRMTNNCIIFSGMEDMNVWYRS